MNKLILRENKDITNGSYEIEVLEDIVLNLKEDIKLTQFDNTNNNLVINLDNKVNLEFNRVSVIKKKMDLVVNILDNSNVFLNLIILNENKNKVTLTLNLSGNNSKVTARVRLINKNDYDNIDFICNGKILSKTKDNELVEDLKGLINGDNTIKISPNMEVLTNEVTANHLVTVGYIREEELFYLTSKGIEEDKAKEMLLLSFLTSKVPESLEEKIKMEVIKSE